MEIFNPYRAFVGAFIPNCLMAYPGLSQGAKMCWARLAQYAGKEGVAYPKQETIAKELGVSTAQAKRYISELVDKGFILIERSSDDRLAHAPNKYRFLMHAVFSNAMADEPSEGSDMRPRGGADMRPSNGSDMRRPGGRIYDPSLYEENHRRESEEENHKKIGKGAAAHAGGLDPHSGGHTSKANPEKPATASNDIKRAADTITEAWHAVGDLPSIRAWTDARKRALKARLRDPHWLEQSLRAIAKIPKTPFLIGENDRGWRANIDWLLRPDSVARVLEGAYDGTPRRRNEPIDPFA